MSDLLDYLKYNPDTGIITRGKAPVRVFKSIRDYNYWNKRVDRYVGSKDKDGYLRIRAYSKQYLAHRVAWYLYYGKWPDTILDHINCNREDNRIMNLREITQKENMMRGTSL